jgi:hypothetical protein
VRACAPTQEQLARRDMGLFRESLRAEAEGRFFDALRLAGSMPPDAFSVFRQGKLLLKLGEIGEASRKALISAARADPHIPSLLSYVAYVQWQLEQQGRLTRAVL